MKKQTANVLSLSYEKSLCPENAVLCGADEAGRGPLAGRVYAAAVILPDNYANIPELCGLNDSKKLSEKKRDALAEAIKAHAVAYAVAFCTVEEIEEHNILGAALLAMTRAIEGLAVPPDFALIDGNKTPSLAIPCRAEVGGDGKCPSIAAASILAKTARDAYCREVLDKTYPAYGFAVHKGYGTKAHYAAIETYGLCPEHRPSFFKHYRQKHGKDPSDIQ